MVTKKPDDAVPTLYTSPQGIHHIVMGGIGGGKSYVATRTQMEAIRHAQRLEWKEKQNDYWELGDPHFPDENPVPPTKPRKIKPEPYQETLPAKTLDQLKFEKEIRDLKAEVKNKENLLKKKKYQIKKLQDELKFYKEDPDVQNVIEQRRKSAMIIENEDFLEI